MSGAGCLVHQCGPFHLSEAGVGAWGVLTVQLSE